MNKNVRKYLREIRSLFPKFGKEERKYLNGFKSMIADCPDEESLSDRERLEAAYGTPEEVVRKSGQPTFGDAFIHLMSRQS